MNQYLPCMRKLSLLLVVTALAAGTPAAVASPVHAKPAKPSAELVAKQVAAAASSTRISVGTAVKNKGNEKAPASAVTFYLSRDRKLSSDDRTVGSTTVGKIKPKRFKTTTGIFNLPAGLTAGSYFVVACADSGRAVKERKEDNNCKGAVTPVQVAATTNPKQVTVTYSSSVPIGVVGSVTATATGGTCTDDPVSGGGSCVVAATTGTVTLTASGIPAVLHFASWSGSCTGTTSPYLLSNLTADAACTATFALGP
jgi:CARDB